MKIAKIASMLLIVAVAAFSACPSLAQGASAAGAGPLEKGWQAYKSGDYSAANGLAKEAVKAAPGDPQALELFGRCAMAVLDPASAVGALNLLCGKRGTLADYALLATAYEMLGRGSDMAQALEKAEKGKEAGPEGLYGLAWKKGTVAGRLSLLKRIAQEFPGAPAAIGQEVAFWEGRSSLDLRKPTKPVGPEGVEIELKTIYSLEWAACKTIAGEELNLMVDTASRETIISKDTAERMKLQVVQAAYPPPGAYPKEPAHTYAMIDKLDFGTYQVSNVPVLVVEDEARTLTFREGRSVLKGILGMDLLAGMKVRFDRQKNVLKLFSKDAPQEKFLDGDPSAWKDIPAYPVDGQIFIRSSVGTKATAPGLLALASSLVLIPENALAGTGVQADSKKIIDLTPSGSLELDPDSRHSSVDRTRRQTLGWLDQALPLVGKVRTVPKAAEIGFAGAKFQVNDMPIYPGGLGGQIPVGVVIGKKITDIFALAYDLSSGKLYYKQVMFNK